MTNKSPDQSPDQQNQFDDQFLLRSLVKVFSNLLAYVFLTLSTTEPGAALLRFLLLFLCFRVVMTSVVVVVVTGSVVVEVEEEVDVVVEVDVHSVVVWGREEVGIESVVDVDVDVEKLVEVVVEVEVAVELDVEVDVEVDVGVLVVVVVRCVVVFLLRRRPHRLRVCLAVDWCTVVVVERGVVVMGRCVVVAIWVVAGAVGAALVAFVTGSVSPTFKQSPVMSPLLAR